MKQLSYLFFVILLSSCASTKLIELGNKTALKGTEVSQKALDVFVILDGQAEIDKSFQDRLKVLTNPNPAAMNMPNTPLVAKVSKQVETRVLAYQSLLTTYKFFTQLTDKKYGDKTKEAVSSLQESYNAIAKLPDIPASVASKLPDISKMATLAIQAKKIKNHNEILTKLTELYVALWNEDEKIWNDYLDRVYSDYADGLVTVDSKRYDAKKIAAIGKEPYSDEAVLVLIYRIHERDSIVKQKNEIKQQLNNLGKALKELNKAHVEISKTKTEVSDVIQLLNSVENLLKQK